MRGAGRRKRMASRGKATDRHCRRAAREGIAFRRCPRLKGRSASYAGRRMIAGTRLSWSGIPPAAGIFRAP
jgi:hypothetical protein